ncbi:MAG: dipeptidase [Proteobacteria bacterium]|nr:dipeptidase [Pseudomonadota bacterium]
MARRDLDPVLARLEAGFDGALARLCELLRIPSVSTDPAYREHVRRAAGWLADRLRDIGFEARLCETAGHPVVLAHHPGPQGGGAPRVLYYGHYDVQPPDPLGEWTSGPFEPTLVEGPHGKRLIARGAVDDKGQLMTFVEAFRAFKEAGGTLPAPVTVMLEGEEESGSASLPRFLDEYRRELAADICVVSDTASWDIATPAITYMLRGLVYIEATLRGPSHDLHSGMYGGAVLNPINALARVLAELHDDTGRVRVPGFYDGIVEPGADELAGWASLGFDEGAFLAGVGLRTPSGESGRTALERLWSRPTCDANGIFGGYTGEGAKTVIPASASVKLSCRLVPGQDPERVLAGLKSFLEARTPADGRWEIKSFGASPAIRVATDSPYLKAARAGLARTYGREPVLIGCGGSIPVVGMIQDILGFDSLLVGFGLEDDRVHSPNEKFELACFRNGMRAQAAILAEIAAIRPAGKAAQR